MSPKSPVLMVFALTLCFGAADEAKLSTLIVQLSEDIPTASRIRALNEIGKMGPAATEARKVVTGVCDDPDAIVRSRAIRTLGLIGGADDIPFLSAVAESKKEPASAIAAAMQSLADITKVPLDDTHKKWLAKAHTVALIGGRILRIHCDDVSGASSRHLTLDEAKKGLKDRKAGLASGPAWMDAPTVLREATLLPSAEEGAFGRIYPATVVQILGSDEMLVDRVGLTSSDGSPLVVMVRGYPTKGLVDGGWWFGDIASGKPGGKSTGTTVYVAGTTEYLTTLGAKRTVLLMVPLAAVKRGITFDEFQTLSKEHPDVFEAK